LAHRFPPAHLKRYRQIAEVLVRHGLGSLVGVFGLQRFVPFARGVQSSPHRSSSSHTPEHLREALEELGATFIKLGQILSTRADLLPSAYQGELARLQDQVAPVPGDVIEEVVQTALGRPLQEVFASFDHKPLAAASIGQVHAATLRSGVEVVVKVRRPGVVECIEEDLEIMQSLAAAANRRWALAQQYDLPSLVQEFAATLRSELDYLREGRNAERFAANFAGNPSLHIPKVFWETTTEQVLTLERIRGIKISDLAALETAGIARPALAERATRVLLKMVFEDGFYHADPHPGNFFIESDGRIGLIDYGMVGTVSGETREQLIDLLLAITSQQSERLVETLLRLGITRQRIDRAQLRLDMERVLGKYYERPLGEFTLGPFLSDFFAIVRRHHLRLPPELALLCKTMVMDEGLGTQLDPSFNLARLLAPYAQRLLMQRYNPFFWLPHIGQVSRDAAQLGRELPQQLRRIMGDLERGDLEIGMHPTAFEPLLNRIERLVNRLVLGVIASAFIVGLAILTLASFVRPINGLTWVGALLITGFVIVSALGVFLAWSILHTRRRV
jgi:ubiquinone biosynthesis protein